MRRQKVVRCAIVVFCLLAAARPVRPADQISVRTLVPTFTSSTSLGANASTILALRLWTTLRPRPNPNPKDLYFGSGQIEWSERVIESTPDAANQMALETGSDLALWGGVEEYGSGIVVLANLRVVRDRPATDTLQKWVVKFRDQRIELRLPSNNYQFSPLVIPKDVAAKYSRPNQITVCEQKSPDCAGRRLGSPFRSIRIDGDFALVRQPSGATGWVLLPDLSQAQGEVIDFTAALISYLRGDFEQAEQLFSRVRDSRTDSLVHNDATLLAGVSRFRRGEGIDGVRSAHEQNPYSRFGVQALVMANISMAQAAQSGESRTANLKEANSLIESYRHLFSDTDPWLVGVVRSLSPPN
ncbi:hypothetical protein JQ616_35470 [Bradyrhizobium tropiciagri]|uniref:hypothetical protein n=1 Tax=Bradyrhizobium tropiciagri TaxID=312253 RepID=UPI001BA6AE88|nr:hypothetical protein [Bradyrhizobium tropiciagri]MBR0900280.1 hypothetical protein [Bradyrhizobium tropiciagri]